MKPDVYSILKKRYPEGQYALMAEVSDAAGYNRSRSADYIAVGLWPSRGLSIIGIELKSFRSDWLGELKNPRKAENIFKYCDYFWLLTIDDTIAKMEEIPDNWGWMCIKGSRIIVKKEALKLTPEPISKTFMCAMFKRASDKSRFVHVDSIQDKIDQAKESARNERKMSLDRAEKEIMDLKKKILDFEKASGIKMMWGDQKKAGEAVNFILSGGAKNQMNELRQLQRTAEVINRSITGYIESIESLSQDIPTKNDPA